MTTRSQSKPFRALLLAAASALPCASGCYDAQLILERARNDAIKTRLEEVDLGEFHFTLPRDPANNEMTEVVMQVYGRAVRYRIAGIEDLLEKEDFIMRQEVMLAVRQTTNEELADPELTVLRERLMKAVNSVLGETPIESVGFHHIRLIRH